MDLVEQIDRREVPPLLQLNLHQSHESRQRHPEIISNQQQALHVLPVALTQRPHQFRSLRILHSVQPLLELIDDHQHLPARHSTPAKMRDRTRQQHIAGNIRTRTLQRNQQSVFRVTRRRLRESHPNMIRQTRQQTSTHKRGLAAPRRTVKHTHPERLLRVRSLHAALPKSNALRNTLSVRRARQHPQIKHRIVRIERTQTFRDDLRLAAPDRRLGLFRIQPGAQILRQLSRRLVAIRRTQRHALQRDPLQLTRQQRVDLTGSLRRHPRPA